MSKASRTAGAVPRRERRESERASHRERYREQRSIWRGPLPYVAAAIVIVGAIAWSVASSRPGATPTPTQSAADAVVTSVTRVPADVYDKVGAGGIADPLKATGFEMLRGASGRPLFIYVGAEFCPFCASEKWSVVAALARFGTWQGLELSTSSSSDAFPDTPTLTFRNARFESQVIEVSVVETADREGRRIATMTSEQERAMERSNSRGAIPFVSVAERYVAVGSGYRPEVLRSKSWQQIAAEIRDPSTQISRGVIGNANWITAKICEQTNGQPASVCSSAAVRSLR